MSDNNNEVMQELVRLREENARLSANQVKPKTGMKVSEKGALSVYGMGRFPVTLYKSQWKKLLAKAEEIQNFITENDSKLTEKVQPELPIDSK